MYFTKVAFRKAGSGPDWVLVVDHISSLPIITHVFLSDGHLGCFCLLAFMDTHKNIDIPSSPFGDRTIVGNVGE